jgi:arabinofuranosyltransferase
MDSAKLTFWRDLLEKPVHRNTVPIFVFIIFVGVFLNAFWLGDDSFITFRTLDNFLNGYGLRWNIDERVQSYTNPLWMFYVLPFYAVTGDIYYAALIASLILASLMMYIVVKKNQGDLRILFVLSLFILCRSFIEYTSSGLENVLSYVLIVVYYYLFLDAVDMKTGKVDGSKGYRLSLVYALLILNRMDLSLLLFFPHAYFGVHYFIGTDRKKIKEAALYVLAMMPVLLWLVFSLVYYGFPFPNTFYAKTTLPVDDVRMRWIIGYYHYALDLDPFLLLVPIVSVVLALLPGRRLFLLFVAGIVVQNLYIVKIGGDFMGGRWLTQPYLLAVLIIASIFPGQLLSRFRYYQFGAAILTLLLLLNVHGRMLKNNPFAGDMTADVLLYAGTVDERQGWGAFTLLKGCLSKKVCYDVLPTWRAGVKAREEKSPITVASAIGFYGFAAGPDVKIIDSLGLSDPLLSRMPCKPVAPGHCVRSIPAGYDQPGQQITDLVLAEYERGLREIVTGPLFSVERWRLIKDYNVGERRHLQGFLEKNTKSKQ